MVTRYVAGDVTGTGEKSINLPSVQAYDRLIAKYITTYWNSCIGYTEWNEMENITGILCDIWKEAVAAYVKALCRYFTVNPE
jgi:hypothetical protein